MKVSKKSLVLFAAIVWSIAGLNVLKIGVSVYSKYLVAVNFALSTIVFLIFWNMIFKKMVDKNIIRIKSLPHEKYNFWKFFDLKSFLIMAFMMSMGISLRLYNLVPDVFIAVFYSGLGTALALAGVKYFYKFLKY
ncbi:MAG: hypothetical protein SOR77_04010 [Peptoniphilus sp.]|uniref:hypothetical protein n=1 Tax=Peptoniphilus sp. TaxID=1971214 RepID=UPI002A757BC2|nr:hypothetical protein [Peptoniphilus sp.]MDY2986782.1 hypothetical protein [Peptoniphilus sp.]